MPTKKRPSSTKYSYPRAAELLLHGRRLPGAELDDTLRRDLADLTREFVNWVKQVKAAPGAAAAKLLDDPAEQRAAHDRAYQDAAAVANQVVAKWFTSANEPSLADAEQAFTRIQKWSRTHAWFETDPASGAVLLEFPVMNPGRLLDYGIPTEFPRTRSQVETLAAEAALPPGILLVAFRMTRASSGAEIPTSPALKARIDTALRNLGFEPYAGPTVAAPEHATTTVPERPTLEQLTLFSPETPGATWPIAGAAVPDPVVLPTVEPETHEARVDRMLENLEVLKAEVSLNEFYSYFGGKESFTDQYSVRASTFRDYWYRGRSCSPSVRTLKRLERIIDAFSEAVAEHGLRNVEAVRRTLEVKAQESPAIAQITRSRPTADDGPVRSAPDDELSAPVRR